LPGEISSAEWYGLGPGEAYVDTQEAQRIGIWKLPIDEIRTNYIRPQESGNRMDVRWANFAPNKGLGLKVTASPAFMFSAERYTTQDLEKAKHTYDLFPRTFVTLRLDHRHHGIGSSSCGPATLAKYELRSQEFEFGFSLRPINFD